MTAINVVELLFKALPEPMSIWDVKVRDTDVLFTWRGIRVADVLVRGEVMFYIDPDGKTSQ